MNTPTRSSPGMPVSRRLARVAHVTVLMAASIWSQFAQSDTILLDFTSTATDVNNQTTGAFSFSGFGFTGMTLSQVQQAVLNAVIGNYLHYPTVAQNSNSPLPAGKELNWNFEIGSVGNAPSNGDPRYYYVKIGTGISGNLATNQSVFGAASGSSIRNSSGGGPFTPVGSVVAAVWTDHIDNIANLATNDTHRINLIAGTTSHEIGHTFSLAHAGAMAPNPGQSAWGLMGSGATSMPTSQRILSREFTYQKFGQLIGAIGLRNATVPEPGSFVLILVYLTLSAGLGRTGSRNS